MKMAREEREVGVKAAGCGGGCWVLGGHMHRPGPRAPVQERSPSLSLSPPV